MKYLHKYGTRPRDIHRAKRELYITVLSIIAVAALLSGIFLIRSYREEQALPQDGQGSSAGGQGGALHQTREEVALKWASFEEKVLSKAIDLEDLELMEETIEQQRAIIQKYPGNLPDREDLHILGEMQSSYDTQMGHFLYAQSKRLEEKAESLQKSGQTEGAIKSLESSINLQKQINDGYPRSSRRDPSRLHFIESRLILWRTAPIAEKADALKKQALDLRNRKEYEPAKSAIDEALAQQRVLNEQYRYSPSTSLARLKAFEETREQIHAAEGIDTMVALIDEAKNLLDTGNPDAALALINEAKLRQTDLQSKYPDLAEARVLTQEEIATLEDTAASVTDYKKVLEMGSACRTLLRQKNLEPFTNAVSEWLRAAEQFQRDYPRSKYLDQIHIEEVRYLHRQREALPSLIDTVYTNLIPLGDSGTAMYRTEVPQFLYQSATGNNPSNNRGPLLPVESVTWAEANRFTELLAWILAVPVKLPGMAHFKEALGSVDPGSGEAEFWSNWSSGRKTQVVGTSPANKAGYHDLLGNVSEWLSVPDSELSEYAPLVGGSARDSLEILVSIPVDSIKTTERNRFAGFRFIVETGL